MVVSFRVDRELKERMDRLRHVNWSEVVRRAIYEYLKALSLCFATREASREVVIETSSLGG